MANLSNTTIKGQLKVTGNSTFSNSLYVRGSRAITQADTDVDILEADINNKLEDCSSNISNELNKIAAAFNAKWREV